MHNISSSDIRGFFRDYWFLMRPYKSEMLKAIGWILLLQVTALAEPYGVKYVIDRIQAQSIHGLTGLSSILGGLFVLLCVGGLVQVIKNWKTLLTLMPITRDIPKRAVKKLLALPLSFHERENAGLLIGKVTKGAHKTDEVTATLLFDIFSLGLQTTVTAVVIAFFSPPSLAVFLITVVIFGVVTYKVKQKLAPIRKKRHEEDGRADELFGQAITNVATVQVFAQEKRESEQVGAVRDGIYERMVPEFRTHLKFDFLRNLIVSLGRVIVVGICGWAAIQGRMTTGTLFFVVALADRVFVGCYRFGAIFDRMQEASESIGRLVEVLRTDEHIKDPPNPVDASSLTGSVSFRNVTHVYAARLPSDEQKPALPALSDINLEIKDGEQIGVAGLSGGGKSTLLKLLLRVDDPTEGGVRIGGVDLKLLRRADFRSRIGYVPQEVEIFDMSVADNIAYGRPGAGRDKIVEAAKIAHADGFISKLPGGYDEMVGNRGMRLSGGQKQRIGIARAVLMDPKILIFDEATSSVDSISEYKIQQAVKQLRGSRTMILIAHRLSTVQNADRIFVLEDGRIIESGTHAGLMADQGRYHEMVLRQQADEEAM